MIACKRTECIYHKGDVFVCHAPNILIDENGICKRYWAPKKKDKNKEENN